MEFVGVSWRHHELSTYTDADNKVPTGAPVSQLVYLSSFSRWGLFQASGVSGHDAKRCQTKAEDGLKNGQPQDMLKPVFNS